MMTEYLPDDAALAAIQTNVAAQQANNEARIRELRRYATKGFAAVFDLAPLLLNVNSPDQPGFVDDPQTPCGVRFIERQPWLPHDHRHDGPNLRQPENENPAVESLFLIGSSGSVGHTASSDLDYWVCYEPDRLNGRALELFQKKLTAISEWARLEHDTEANFYPVNLKELAAGRITHLSETETEGEVAPLLLLEELYRTILHVAGRPAVWLFLPPDIDRDRYQAATAVLTSGESSQYVDLGFPGRPAPQEFLAAALWLTKKSEADPFKGIMKIVAILEYVESGAPLLCNSIKSAVLKAAPDQLPIDPYVLTIDAITEYGVQSLTPEQLELLRTAAALKVLGSTGGDQVFVMPKNSPKRLILEERAARWGWGDDRLMRLTNYSRWPERERLNLGEELLTMLSSVYVRIAHYLISNYPGEVNPQDESLAPLAARLLARRGGLDSTVESLPSLRHRFSIASRLAVYYDEDSGEWRLHAKNDDLQPPDENNLIYAARRAIRLAAWMVHNQVLRPALTLARSNGKNGLTGEIVSKTIEILKQHFPPWEPLQERANLWSAGGQGQVLVFLNFENPGESNLLSADYILRTGWGEMRHFYVDVKDLASGADQYLKIVWSLLREGNARPESVIFPGPDNQFMLKHIGNIRAALAAQKRQRPDEKKSRIDI